MKTAIINDKKVDRKWLLIDAEGVVLGRLATRVAELLRGKHKAIWSPEVDAGDNVVIINADKVVLTGNKAETKEYFRHSGYAGGGKFTSFAHAQEKDVAFPVVQAVKGMLPKNSLGKRVIKKLYVYGGSEHPHAAQSPEAVSL